LVPQVALGYLGAELRLDAGRQKLRDHEARDRRRLGRRRRFAAEHCRHRGKIGERIVAVNGQRVSAERPPQTLLVHQANATVELTLVSNAASGITTRNVLVATLADELPAP